MADSGVFGLRAKLQKRGEKQEGREKKMKQSYRQKGDSETERQRDRERKSRVSYLTVEIFAGNWGERVDLGILNVGV